MDSLTSNCAVAIDLFVGCSTRHWRWKELVFCQGLSMSTPLPPSTSVVLHFALLVYLAWPLEPTCDLCASPNPMKARNIC
eukprot:6455076-Amphidinium_carterae.1